jgi:hypothetical protein
MVFMKKLAVFLFILTFSQSFAYENVAFPWQLSYSQPANQEINFLQVNPLFFDIDTIFSQELFSENIIDDHAQKKQSLSAHFPKNDISGFFTLLALWTASALHYSSLNDQGKEVLYDAWEQQRNEEAIRQKFIDYNYRNF